MAKANDEFQFECLTLDLLVQLSDFHRLSVIRVVSKNFTAILMRVKSDRLSTLGNTVRSRPGRWHTI